MTSAPLIRHVLARNPSLLTGAGTNTWLVGAQEVAVIDPGPDSPDHMAAILNALGPGQSISHIIVTHAHLDHAALAPRLAQRTGAPIFAFGRASEGRSPLMSRLAASLPEHGEGLDHAFAPDVRLNNNETLSGPDWTLTALHTPGHLGGHLCFALGDILFSGDHVMGWSTTIVSPPDGDMADYMASLDRLAAGRWTRFLPGHGDPIQDPAARLAELTAHRRTRESQIIAALDQGAASLPDLTRRIYREIPDRLLPAAERNVLAHLIDLATRNQIKALPALQPDAVFARP